jgi:aryl-alcohol dehydrogenase
MTTVTAAVIRNPNDKFTVENLELDELRPNEVRVRVVAVGVCHTDVAMRDAVFPIPMPVVLGRRVLRRPTQRRHHIAHVQLR